MWAADKTAGRWIRDDGDQGYLLADGDLMLELHGDTLHTYRRDPKAGKTTAAGGPLDGFVHESTTVSACDLTPAAAPVDAATAWRLLGDRAATVDAARARLV